MKKVGSLTRVQPMAARAMTAARAGAAVLVWRGDFGGRDATMTVECPPPPKGSGPLSALGD